MKILLTLIPILLPAALLLGGGLVCVAACTTSTIIPDRSTVTKFKLKRYMGTWYEIARYENRFQRGMERVKARYTLQRDGKVEVVNSGINPTTKQPQEARGKAKTTPIVGRLKVSFFWIFYADYNILAVGDDYDWALVGSRNNNYLWILSRTPSLPAMTLERILHLARRKGYNTDKLRFTEQE